MSSMKDDWIFIAIKAGQGRGNWGHSGRPGKVGGSGPSTGGGTASAKLPTPVDAYHVTYRDVLPGIMKDGLKPTSEVGVSRGIVGTVESYDIDGVFVANAAQAMVLYDRFKENGDDPVLLSVYLPKGTTVYEDQLMPESSLVVPGRIPKRRVRVEDPNDIRSRSRTSRGRATFNHLFERNH